MRFKDIFMPLLMSMALVMLINYFFFGDKEVQNAERSRIAPRLEEINRPLSYDVDFVDKDLDAQASLDEIETKFAKFVFSTKGASLDSAEFKHDVEKKDILMSTLSAISTEDKAFLLAFDGPTPLNYKLIEKSDDSQAYHLKYVAENPYKITKEFIVYKNIPKIDLSIDVDLKSSSGAYLRLFYPAPKVPDLKNDVISGIVSDGTKIAKNSVSIVKEGRYWESPNLFGSEDRFFVHSMVADQNTFVGRAFYKVDPQGLLTSVLETTKVQGVKNWSLSFYFGPKRLDLMTAVDPRLSGTLDYGWLEPICIVMLKFMNFIYEHVHSYGWAIILLTILMKLIMIPFTINSRKKMVDERRRKKEMDQKMAYIQEKYKDDRQRMQAEQAALLRDYGLPGMGGCIPMLLQIPVFFSLQRILYNAVELYKVPFLWLKDLSMPDPLHILPILAGIGIIMSMNQSNITGSPSGKWDAKSKIFQYAMGLIISAVMFSLSAGSVLYIAFSTMLNVLQVEIQAMWQRK